MSTPARGKTAEYILPLRWTDDSDLPDLATYLRRLTGWIAVTVVDGSAPDLFEHHCRVFPPAVRHLRPMAETGSARPGEAGVGRAGNGKVAGVMTGVRVSTADLLVIADDDVRYTRESLAAVVQHLSSADVVRPQNYYDRLPWHARWDTARTLINRAWSADFPGTLALRRSTLVAAQGYDGVLFENLELIRTIKAAGGCEKVVPDLFVARRPPKARHFLKQRVRHAYDDFAQPRRLGAELALLPAILAAARLPGRLRVSALLSLAAASAVAAGIGRRRHRGAAVFPFNTVWFAPLWTVERAACIWIALGLRLSGGMPYAGSRIKTAAHSEAELRLRHGRLAGIRHQDRMDFHSNAEQEQK